MKKMFSLFLAAMLTLSLTACGQPQPTTPTTLPPTTEEPTAAVPETQPATVPAPTDPAAIEAEISLEGTPCTLVMHRFDGGNYVVYIPRDEWALTTDLQDGLLTDRWTWTSLDLIHFDVISFAHHSPEEAKAMLLEKYSTYALTSEENMAFGGLDQENWMYLEVSIVSDGTDTFAMVSEYPTDAGDGLAPRIAAMMNSFQIR